MNSFTDLNATAVALEFTKLNFAVKLKDGRSLQIPLAWFPKLNKANLQQLNNYELMGNGQGIYWPDLDEDISVSGLLAGKKAVI